MNKKRLLIFALILCAALAMSPVVFKNVNVQAASSLTINSMPQSTTVVEGELAYFSVKASGTGLKYTWEYKYAGDNNWTVWTSKTTASISVAYASYRNNMSLRCTVSDSSGNKITTGAVTLTYKKAPATIVTQPSNASVEEGQLAYFSVKAKGTGLKYLWEYKYANNTSWTKWTSKTTASISVAYSSIRNGMKLRCVVTDSTGNQAVSNEVTLSYYRQLTIKSQPVSTTVNEGELAYFTVSARGTNVKYQWEYQNAGSNTWVTWSSKTKPNISVAYVKSRNNMKLRCLITDSLGTKLYTNTVTLTYKFRVYDRAAAVAFARKAYNTTYQACTSLASCCLYVGGVPNKEDFATPVNDAGAFGYKAKITTVGALYNYLINHNMATCTKLTFVDNKKVKNIGIEPGDILMVKTKSGSYKHNAVITEVTDDGNGNCKIKFCQRNVARLDKELYSGWAANWTSDSEVYVLHIIV